MRTTIVLVHGAFAESASGRDRRAPVTNGFAPESGENCFGLAAMQPILEAAPLRATA